MQEERFFWRGREVRCERAGLVVVWEGETLVNCVRGPQALAFFYWLQAWADEEARRLFEASVSLGGAYRMQRTYEASSELEAITAAVGDAWRNLKASETNLSFIGGTLPCGGPFRVMVGTGEGAEAMEKLLHMLMAAQARERAKNNNLGGL